MAQLLGASTLPWLVCSSQYSYPSTLNLPSTLVAWLPLLSTLNLPSAQLISNLAIPGPVMDVPSVHSILDLTWLVAASLFLKHGESFLLLC